MINLTRPHLPPSLPKGAIHKRKKKNPNAPKRALSAYMFFFKKRSTATTATTANAAISSSTTSQRWRMNLN